MGALRRVRDGVEVFLRAQGLAGRSAACSLRIDGRYVSNEHAKLLWTGSDWKVRDLGSSNGTFVDGKRLDPGGFATIRRGSRIEFGDADEAWEMCEAGGPTAMAIDLEGGEVVRAFGDVLALPSDADPMVAIYPDPLGEGWCLEEANDARRPTHDLAIVEAGGRRWKVELPSANEATPIADTSLALEAISLRFAVSRNEERVEITVLRRGLSTNLEVREHGYLLLTLARARQRDSARPQDERGWLDVQVLTRMLKVDSNWIYVATHRARQQLSAIGCQGGAGIVEVQRGKRRLGTDRFEIVSL